MRVLDRSRRQNVGFDQGVAGGVVFAAYDRGRQLIAINQADPWGIELKGALARLLSLKWAGQQETTRGMRCSPLFYFLRALCFSLP
jgi:hypothetical protein